MASSDRFTAVPSSISKFFRKQEDENKWGIGALMVLGWRGFASDNTLPCDCMLRVLSTAVVSQV
jgi:hypothetical protein